MHAALKWRLPIIHVVCKHLFAGYRRQQQVGSSPRPAVCGVPRATSRCFARGDDRAQCEVRSWEAGSAKPVANAPLSDVRCDSGGCTLHLLGGRRPRLYMRSNPGGRCQFADCCAGLPARCQFACVPIRTAAVCQGRASASSEESVALPVETPL
jgi:hypothetical protein